MKSDKPKAHVIEIYTELKKRKKLKREIHPKIVVQRKSDKYESVILPMRNLPNNMRKVIRTFEKALKPYSIEYIKIKLLVNKRRNEDKHLSD